MPALTPRSESTLVARYGPLMTLRDVAEILRYPSLPAARKARLRGKFPVQLVKLPNRRGWWATTRAVADYLESIGTEKDDALP